MATSQPTTFDMITWWFVRNYFEQTDKGRNVPAALKYLMRNFSSKIFNCNILSMKQDLDLFKLLSQQIPIVSPSSSIKIKALYHASDHQFLASKFHQCCDNHCNTITIIKSNFNNIFGGYTTIPWSSKDGKAERDKGESFVFLLHTDDALQECPKVWKYEHPMDDIAHTEVFQDKDFGPSFGWNDIIISDRCNFIRSQCASFNKNYIKESECLCGGNLTNSVDELYWSEFTVIDYSVFEIK